MRIKTISRLRRVALATAAAAVLVAPARAEELEGPSRLAPPSQVEGPSRVDAPAQSEGPTKAEAPARVAAPARRKRARKVEPPATAELRKREMVLIRITASPTPSRDW